MIARDYQSNLPILINKDYQQREDMVTENKVNCAIDCVNGCVLGEQCPNREYAAAAAKFISNTSLDQMLEIAEAALRQKRLAPPKWVIPDFPETK